MPRYIGKDQPYGIFEKQVLGPFNGIAQEFILLYRVAQSTSILTVRNGIIQEPNVDYTLNDGGRNILFSFIPNIGDEIFLIYLGRELAVAQNPGNIPYRFRATGNGAATTFVLFGATDPAIPEQALIVFDNGVEQKFGIDFTLDLTGKQVIFTTPPAPGNILDFYVHGVERTDLVTVDDYAITSRKLAHGIDIGSVLDPAGNIVATNLTLNGNLTVLGTQTIINSATLEIADNEIVINSDYVSGVPVDNGSIIVRRGSSPDAKIIWDESVDQWQAGAVGDLQKIIRNTEFTNHTSNTSNPHLVTKSQVGLGNVTDDAQLKRSPDFFATFSWLPSGQAAINDVFIVEDASNSYAKCAIAAEDILPATLPNDHDFTGNVVFSGNVTIGNEQSESVTNFLTTNGSTVAALVIPIPDNTATFFEAKIISRKNDSASNKTYWATIEGAVQRNNAGNAVLVGTPTIEEDALGGALYQASAGINGINLEILVAGEAENVHWTVHVTFFNAT